MTEFIEFHLPPAREKLSRLVDRSDRVEGPQKFVQDLKKFAISEDIDIHKQEVKLTHLARWTGFAGLRGPMNPGDYGYVAKEDGARRFSQGRYPEARELFTEAILDILSLDEETTGVAAPPLPSPTADWLPLRDPKIKSDKFLDILSCAANCIQCAMNENDLPLALDWLEEFQNMYTAFTTRGPGSYAWSNPVYEYEELYTLYLKTCLRATKIYQRLGNTPCEYEAALQGYVRGKGYRSPNIQALVQQCRAVIDKFRGVRHPDAYTIKTFQIVEPTLQVRGVWKRFRIEKEDRPPSRYAFPNCTWRGNYYVFGGLHAMGKHYYETWKLDMRQPEAGWERLRHATPMSLFVNLSYCPCVVYQDRAYLFTGKPRLLVFDLEREAWDEFPTALPGAQYDAPNNWPEPADGLSRHTAQVIRDKMYVFGGSNSLSKRGRDLLLCLDFRTARWEELSGLRTVRPTAGVHPGSRQNCISWVVDSKLYVAFGAAEQTMKEPADGPSMLDYCYRDIWSYNVDENRWTHEKLCGNPPCRRNKAACTYNEKWNSAIVFGGVHCTLNYFDKQDPPAGQLLWYSYLSDVFLWSKETQTWSIVLCRGCPPYRAFTSIVSDPETGRTFMYGGYIDTSFTPGTRASAAQSFDDLWELCVDIPGGGFTDSDRAAWNAYDLRFSQLGPWRQCFTCGSIGRLRECLGTCMDTDGGAVFCTQKCQDLGWKEHKTLNGCRNIGREP